MSRYITFLVMSAMVAQVLGNGHPTSMPSPEPSIGGSTPEPTTLSLAPTPEPTAPTSEPTSEPTAPTPEPTSEPTAPSPAPSAAPTAAPATLPTPQIEVIESGNTMNLSVSGNPMATFEATVQCEEISAAAEDMSNVTVDFLFTGEGVFTDAMLSLSVMNTTETFADQFWVFSAQAACNVVVVGEVQCFASSTSARARIGPFTCECQEPLPTPTPSVPSTAPSVAPSSAPSMVPSNAPTTSPIAGFGVATSDAPTLSPSNEPTLAPSNEPTPYPTQAMDDCCLEPVCGKYGDKPCKAVKCFPCAY